MEFDWVFVALVVGSIFAAAFNAAFSVGGAMIVLAVTTVVLPVTAVVPLHSTLLAGSVLGRVAMFWRYVDWKIVVPFLVGSLFGTLLGARTYAELPEDVIAIAIGLVMLIAIWLPQVPWRPKLKHPWAIVGFLHSFLSTMFAYGALFHSIILHSGLLRRQIVGTMAGCFVGMTVFKVFGYAYFGFDYSPYLVVILASIFASLLGTWMGKRLSEQLPEQAFRLIYRILITVTAIRLLYTALFAPDL